MPGHHYGAPSALEESIHEGYIAASLLLRMHAGPRRAELMANAQDIAFDNGAKCKLELESVAAVPGSDPELTVSTYQVSGLSRGALSILASRTHMPSLVKVEVVDRATQLSTDELEQMRKAAEGIIRAQTQ